MIDVIDTKNFSLRFGAWWVDGHFRPVRAVRHAWQRWTRGFDDTELWCLDLTIARFVLPRLKAFRDVVKVGVPAEFIDGDSEEDIERGGRAFALVLDKMIYAFECKVYEDKYLPELVTEPCSAGGWDGKRFTPSSFIAWREAQKARQVLIDEGMALFTKYMHCLWD